jgi:xylose isomerase
MSLFSEIEPIRYEGPATEKEFAYRVYDKDCTVLGKRMEEWLRLTVCYWHSFNWPGADMFGGGTLTRPWLGQPVTQAMAEEKLDAAFDFFTRLGTPYFVFHDVDAMASADTLREHVKSLRHIEDLMAKKMAAGGVKLLWGTANLFSHPRYAAGAATSPDPEVFAWAAAQVRFCMETTQRLNGENYVLWGGREGYDTLLNTGMSRELDHYGRFLSMVVERIGNGLTFTHPVDQATRATLRIVNDRQEIDFYFRLLGQPWRRTQESAEISGMHHNILGGVLDVRPAISAWGSNNAAFRNFHYWPQCCVLA